VYYRCKNNYQSNDKCPTSVRILLPTTEIQKKFIKLKENMHRIKKKKKKLS